MSKRNRPDRDDERDDRDDDRDEKKDPKEPLSNREVFELYLHDLALRPYLFGALGGLAMVFLILFLDKGSDVGAVLITVYGLAILALRWTIAPPVWLMFVFWFTVFPFGIPGGGYENPYEIRETHFRVVDVILILSILVYLRCLYRIFGIVQQALPFENVLRRKGDHPVRRPVSHIDPNEIGWLIGVAAVLVLLGQGVWWLVNALEFTPTDEDSPLRWADSSSSVYARSRRGRPPGEFTPGASRFFVLLGGLFFGFLLVRLVFGYWRLRMMNAAEGAMVTTDTSWAESHRERVRVEKWRIWGRERAARKAKEEARAERERRKKEAEVRERRRKIDEHTDEATDRRAKARARDEEDEDDRPRRKRR
jgi:hypothetical protein